MTRRDVRFGVIGCGTISYWTHLRLLPKLPGAQVVALADPSEEALERARRLVDVEVHRDAAQLLARDHVDAVVIAAPTALHADLATAACRSGKHVYLEKPLAMSHDGATRVAAEMAAAGVRSAVGYHRRLHPSFEHARMLLAGGVVGRVREVQTVFAEPVGSESMPDWKRRRATGGGVLLDLGVHHFDLVRWVLGEELTVRSCSIESRDSDHDTATVAMDSDRGTVVQSLLSFRSGPADTIEFLGEKGTLRVDRHRARLDCRVPRRFGYGTRRHWIPWRAEDLSWRAQKLVRPSFEPSFGRALAAFARVVADPGAARGELASVEDGVSANALVSEAEALAGYA